MKFHKGVFGLVCTALSGFYFDFLSNGVAGFSRGRQLIMPHGEETTACDATLSSPKSADDVFVWLFIVVCLPYLYILKHVDTNK